MYNKVMVKFRHTAARISGSAVARGMALVGRQSTALPGYVAEMIAPDVLDGLVDYRRFKERIIITGTNGKTTTTHLIAQIMSAQGRLVVSNASGSNLKRGVITTLLSKKQRSTVKKQSLVLEVDEASLPKVCRSIRPTHIIVLNVFRDQLDRYGEVDATQAFILKGIRQTQAQLLLCADDPWVAALAPLSKKPALFFGLDNEQLQALPHDRAADLPVSPITRSPYHYTQRYFSHLGVYAAIDKSFVRPEVDLRITHWEPAADGGMQVRAFWYKQPVVFMTHLSGVYSLYNLAAALLLSESLGISSAGLESTLQKTSVAFGRQEVVNYEGAAYQFFLIKNPAGFNQVIASALRSNKDRRPLVIIINDNFADGRDVSWLWDVAIEDIQSPEPIYVAGTRAYEMALRLEYAGIGCLVVQDGLTALKEAGRRAKRVRVLPTYTALLELRKQLALNLEHQS